MKKGDRVVLKGREDVRGVITDSRYVGAMGASSMEYYVEYDDKNLIPQKDWHTEGFLEIELQEGQENNIKTKGCTCGLKYARSGGKHSDWCDLYRKDL